MDYYKFIEKDLQVTDIVATCDSGYVKIEAIVIDGETQYEDASDDDLEDLTGIIFENEYGELEFICHSEILGLDTEGF